MRRREFIGLMCGAATWPLKASAQQSTNLPLVAVINPFTEDIASERTAALRLGLKQAGLVEGTHYPLHYVSQTAITRDCRNSHENWMH